MSEQGPAVPSALSFFSFVLTVIYSPARLRVWAD